MYYYFSLLLKIICINFFKADHTIAQLQKELLEMREINNQMNAERCALNEQLVMIHNKVPLLQKEIDSRDEHIRLIDVKYSTFFKFLL